MYPDKLITHSLMEIYESLNDYRSYLENGYILVEKHLGEIIDNFILDNLIMKIRFNENEYEMFIKFACKIKEMVKSYKIWKLDTGCNCIDEILRGKMGNENSSKLFKIIYKNYE